MKEFDFDQMAKLAKEDPEKFEQVRKEMIEDFINSAPERLQQKLRQLQWKVDAERQRHKTPLGSCIAINDLMMEYFFKFRDTLNAVTGRPIEVEEERDTVVLSFPRSCR